MMNWLRKLMYGRYGTDPLSLVLMGLYLVLYLVASIFRLGVLSWFALIPMAVALFRVFSRNIPKRQAENNQFLALARPAVQWVRMRRTIHKDKDHRYFKCPNCGQYLRVPKGKGKINVTCRSCGVSFDEKT